MCVCLYSINLIGWLALLDCIRLWVNKWMTERIGNLLLILLVLMYCGHYREYGVHSLLFTESNNNQTQICIHKNCMKKKTQKKNTIHFSNRQSVPNVGMVIFENAAIHASHRLPNTLQMVEILLQIPTIICNCSNLFRWFCSLVLEQSQLLRMRSIQIMVMVYGDTHKNTKYVLEIRNSPIFIAFGFGPLHFSFSSGFGFNLLNELQFVFSGELN